MKALNPEIKTFDSGDSLDRFAAETIISLAQKAVSERDEFHLVLSGGGTPTPIYKLLAHSEFVGRLPWPQTHVYWGDERNVPAEDPGSNYGQVRTILLDRVPIPRTNIHRIKGELSPEEAAADYRQQLRHLGIGQAPWPIFDVVMLGMGGDGHTASLFPGSIAPLEESTPIMAVQADYEDRPANRVTMTPLVFNTARCIIFIVKGHNKARTVASVINGPLDRDRWPIHRINPLSGKVLWLVDNEVAAGL